jgi:hypothetical protein
LAVETPVEVNQIKNKYYDETRRPFSSKVDFFPVPLQRTGKFPILVIIKGKGFPWFRPVGTVKAFRPSVLRSLIQSMTDR